MKRLAWIGLVGGLLCGMAVLHAQAPPAWVPPLGIPMPPFGTTEQAGPATVTVPANGAIPTLSAGSVVQLSPGTYSGSRQIVCAGTQANPAFLRGPAVLPGGVSVTGTFCILENLQITTNDPNVRPPMAVYAPSQSVVIRDSEVSNPMIESSTSGIGIGGSHSDGGPTNLDTVLLRNYIHDMGDRNATFDLDGHGIGIGKATNLWLLDNTLARNSGDGIQINGTVINVHHVFIGRNLSYDNKQMGFWVKTAADVVFSQNIAHSHRPSGSSSGAGFGFQYDPQRVWFISNESYNNSQGFYTGTSNLGGRRDIYLLGNLFRDNNVPDGEGGLGVGVQLNGGAAGDYVVAHNTIVGSPVGIENGWSPPSLLISSNIVRAATPFRFPNGGVQTYRANLTADPLFLAGTHRPGPGSPAIDAGLVEAAYARYQSLYGVSIARDRDGTPRPQGAAWDIGAYEAGGVAPSPSPSPTPTPAPSPSPTPVPSPSPSPTPAPSPSPTPVPSPSPSPVPSPSPSPSPLPSPSPSPTPAPTFTCPGSARVVVTFDATAGVYVTTCEPRF